jgi:hypothetical protein
MPPSAPVKRQGLRELQGYLKDTGRYTGLIDGAYGGLTKQAILKAMEDGPDTSLSELNYRDAAARLGIRTAYILAFAEVEANGAGFERGVPKILFEPHRFSKLTQHRFDATNPTVSYPLWGGRPYPKRIDDRYTQLLEAAGLDCWAGFSAASYGKFQILGENYALCGFDTPWSFAFAQAYDETTQLRSFEFFIRNSKILPALKLGLWETVAAEYNGPAYRSQRYDEKLQKAAAKWERKLAA